MDQIEPLTEREEKIFRWCYSAIIQLAKVKLAEARNDEGTWPGKQLWDGLGGTSKSIFLHQAREEAGIPDDEFLAIVRSGYVDIDDLFDSKDRINEVA